MDYEKFLKHVQEYQVYMVKNSKTISQTSALTFQDGTRIGTWYNAYFTMYKNLQKSKEPLTEDNMKFLKEFEELKRWVEDFKALEVATKNREKLKHYEQKVKEYIMLTTSLKTPIEERDAYQFQDGQKMGLWYNQQATKFSRMLSKNEVFLKYDLQRYQLFLHVIEVRKYYEQHTLKYNETRFDLFTNHVNQYIELLKEEKRILKQTDKRRFEDGTRIGTWYHRKSQIIRNWRKEEKSLTTEQMYQLMAFAQIDLLDFEIRQKEKQLQKTKI